MKTSIFWLRRDLRLHDNHGLYRALSSGHPVIVLFIFDNHIIKDLNTYDSRITFIYKSIQNIHKELISYGSSLLVKYGDVKKVWKELIHEFDIQSVYLNNDYEPYARKRDTEIKQLLKAKCIPLHSFKDHVIFEQNEILTLNKSPYSVFTPYKNKWLNRFSTETIEQFSINVTRFAKYNFAFPKLEEIGFKYSCQKVKPFHLNNLTHYSELRDFPYLNATTYLGPHLRFGTVSIRELVRSLNIIEHEIFLKELVWREFFMQALFHYPQIISENFKSHFNPLVWKNNKEEFRKWKEGNTGYPMVDAGMRELNHTGYMHNRSRMVVASFLCKHLLIDWKWGEKYFAEKLLDYEQASNVGNWQWAASTGCDAVPYFRIFNPTEQRRKFDPKWKYIQEWVPEYNTPNYALPIVEHKFARDRALKAFSNLRAKNNKES